MKKHKEKEVGTLRHGDRFSFIPAAWYGPSIVESISRSGNYLRISFRNPNLINPPGIAYLFPETHVRILKRKTMKKLVAKPKHSWTMPAWMKSYAHLIVNTGGNDIEEMVNGTADPLINLPLSTLQACVKSQVALLEQLYKEKLLK